jgi:hypothetical protein
MDTMQKSDGMDVYGGKVRKCQRGRGEINGFRDPSQGHAQVCPRRKGFQANCRHHLQCHRTLSLPRRTLRTPANPLSEIRRRPLQTGRISKTSACRLLQRSPYVIKHHRVSSGGIFCSPARDPIVHPDQALHFSQNEDNHHLVSDSFWPESKLPATLLSASSGPRIVEGHSVAVPRNQQQPNRDPFHSGRSIYSLCFHLARHYETAFPLCSPRLAHITVPTVRHKDSFCHL